MTLFWVTIISLIAYSHYRSRNWGGGGGGGGVRGARPPQCWSYRRYFNCENGFFIHIPANYFLGSNTNFNFKNFYMCFTHKKQACARICHRKNSPPPQYRTSSYSTMAYNYAMISKENKLWSQCNMPCTLDSYSTACIFTRSSRN